MSINLADFARDIINEILQEGLRDHAPESWRDVPVIEHVLKAQRHSNTAMQIMLGADKKDTEGAVAHQKRASVREFMALLVLIEKQARTETLNQAIHDQ